MNSTKIIKNHYEILGVSKTANLDEIRKAYKKLSMKFHPDKFAKATENEKKAANDAFIDINIAHEILSDEQKRAAYDKIADAVSIPLDDEDHENNFKHPDKIFKTLASAGYRHSTTIMQLHKKFQSEFKAKPLQPKDPKTLLQFVRKDTYDSEVKKLIEPIADQLVPSEFVDPITNEIMAEPYELDCHHFTDKHTLEKIQETQKKDACCPNCKTLIKKPKLAKELKEKITQFFARKNEEFINLDVNQNLGDAPDRFLDPVHMEIMKDPQTLECGHILDKSTLNSMKDAKHDSCPMCRNPLDFEKCTPNKALKSQIANFINHKNKTENATPIKNGKQEINPNANNNDNANPIYQENEFDCQTLFELIMLKQKFGGKPNYAPSTSLLTPKDGFALFARFLKGEFYGRSLAILINEFDDNIQFLKSCNAYQLNIDLLEGMQEIFAMASGNIKIHHGLILSMQKIIDYAKQVASTSYMDFVAPVLQNKYFRRLFNTALEFYWCSDKNIIDDENLKQFDGKKSLEKIYDEKVEKLLSENQENSEIIYLYKTFYKFEKYAHTAPYEHEYKHLKPKEKQAYFANFYRERAQHILDWVPIFGGIAPLPVTANLLLQAGIYFQKAAENEVLPHLKWADEQTAMISYISALKIAQDATPDIELYINTHVLKLLSHFTFVDEQVESFISALMHKTFILANIFPFFENIHSNVDMFTKGESQVLNLMRKLLHKFDKQKRDELEVDHTYVDFLHEAYVSCLKGWFLRNDESDDNAALRAAEKKFRINLMDEILKVNRWTAFDVINNLHNTFTPASSGKEEDKTDNNFHYPSISMATDENAWPTPRIGLKFENSNNSPYLKSVSGFQINHRTNEIKFAYETWKPGDPENQKLFTEAAFYELIFNQITHAAFTLNPSDPDRPYNPFHQMVVEPSVLHQSMFEGVMFTADYLLKFLTVGCMTQYKHPFDLKEIFDSKDVKNNFLTSLPQHLKKIITDFHKNKRTTSTANQVHRFWFEAEEISYTSTDENDVKNTGIEKFAFANMRMVIKKHPMHYDEKGNLIDTDTDDEGWTMYRLKEDEVLARQSELKQPAMIWVVSDDNTSSNQFVLLDNNQFFGPYTTQSRFLAEFNELACDEKNKVIASTTHQSQVIYWITNDIADELDIPAHFSAEHVFAIEFTKHYDEFAKYYPILGSLREECKNTTIVRKLYEMYLTSVEKEKIFAKRKSGEDKDFWKEMEKKLIEELTPQIKKNFSQYSSSYLNLKNQINDFLTSIKSEWPYNTYDEKVAAYESDIQSKCYENNLLYYSSEVQDKIEEGKVAIKANFNNVCAQLKTILNNNFNYCYSETYGEEFIEQFIFYDRKDAFIASLLPYYQEKMLTDITNQYSAPQHLIQSALDNPKNITKLIKYFVAHHVEQIKVQLGDAISKEQQFQKTFHQFGFNLPRPELNLKNFCKLVPASIRHELDKRGHGRKFQSVGGVKVQARTNHISMNTIIGQATMLNYNNQMANNARAANSLVQQNRAWGNAFRDAVAASFQQAGFRVQTEARFNTSLGARYADIKVTTQDGRTVGLVECKTGNSPYTHSQQAKDNIIRNTHSNAQNNYQTYVVYGPGRPK